MVGNNEMKFDIFVCINKPPTHFYAKFQLYNSNSCWQKKFQMIKIWIERTEILKSFHFFLQFVVVWFVTCYDI